MIKILIADDQELIRQSLMIILDNVPDFEVVDCVADGMEVMASVKEEKPDVILMDIRMPRMDGVVCTQRLKELYPDIKIIILTTFDDDEYVFNTAMINEDIASKVLRLFSRMAQSNVAIRVEDRLTEDLKPHEWDIIVLVGSGLSNKEIASRLNLSEGTVRNSLSNILSKLQLRDRTQLAIWAVQTGAVNRPLRG